MTKSIFDKHVKTINDGFKSVDQDLLQRAIGHILCSTLAGHNIFVCGNGASAAIAEHWACDFTKGCYDPNKDVSPRVISLSANIPLMTAIANDISYDDVYSFQVDRLANEYDLLIVISSSGNSPNVVRAVEAAKRKNLFTIALTGFDGGKLKKMVDVCLHVDVQEYEATEDVHQALMQIIAKEIRNRIL